MSTPGDRGQSPRRPSTVRPTTPGTPGRPMPPSISPRPQHAAPSMRQPNRRPPRPQRRARRILFLVVAALLVLALGSWLWVELSLNKVSALSGAANTPGETYLIVGSDSRDGWADDGTEGARTDTILLLHAPHGGPPALISIPRDSLVEIPGYGANKINAAFAYGGAPLLVESVELLSGLTVDHYVEVGFGGVEGLVDAVGGVELCHDTDVNDPYSGMVWTAGCHRVDGATALAFSRMRYEDPLGDIGRTGRQRQVVGAVASEVMQPATFANPVRAYRVTNAGIEAITVSEGTSALDVVGVVQAFRAATGEGGVTGTPPIASLDYRVDGAGSTVLLDPDSSPAFWAAIANGEYAPGTVVGGID